MALKKFSGRILVAPGVDPPVESQHTMPVYRLFSSSEHTSTGQTYFHLLCTLFQLILLDFRTFVLSSHSHFTDEKSKAQKDEGVSQALADQGGQGLEYRTSDQAPPLPLTGARG